MLLPQSEMLKILPHAYPFLMIDDVIDIKIGESIVAVKNITANEWIFQNQAFEIDHLPEPFLIEAAAQAALVLYHVSKIGKLEHNVKYILGSVICKLDGYIKIGDQLIIKAFANKMLYSGGYSEIFLSKNDIQFAFVKIYYSVNRTNE